MIERIFGLFLLGLGIFFVYGGMNLEVSFSYDPLGPKSFPIALGVLLSALSLFVIAKPEKAEFADASTNVKTAIIVVLLVIYQAIFSLAGFLLSTALLVFCISKIFRATTLQALGSAIGVSVSVYLIFGVVLDVPLPIGTLFEALLGGK